MQLLVQPTLRVSPPALATLHAPPGISAEATWQLALARHAWQAWVRGFEGQPRATADALLLRDLIARIGGVRVSIRVEHPEDELALRPAMETLDRVLRNLAAELGAIEAADRGAAPAERAARIATRINRQLELMRAFFAGQPRLACRPRAVRRILRALDREARALADAELDTLPEVALNRERLAAEQATLRAELPLLENEHLRASPGQRLLTLMSRADTLEAGMRGRPTPIERDQLDEIELQLVDIVRQLPAGPALHALATLQEAIDRWEAA